MGWLRTLLSWRDAPTSDSEASVRFSSDIPTPVDDLLTRSTSSDTSPVSRRLALTVPAVLRGRNMLCSIATLPLVTRDRQRVEVRAPLLEQIDRDVPNVVTLAQTVEDLVFDAISWWRITERDPMGFPRYAQHMDAGSVSLQPPRGWRDMHTLPSGTQLPGGVVWVNGEEVPGRDMIRFDSPNPALLTTAARAVRRAILFERAAAMYAEDPRPQDYFTPTDGADPAEDEDIEEILDAWRDARRTRSTGYVPAALAYNTVTAPTPADLQLVELQKQAVIDIANALGLDSEDLQVSTTSRTYANAVDRRIDRINDVLSPFMRAITDRLSMNDVTRIGHTVHFDLDDYMKSNPTERWSTYQTGLQNEVLSVPEVREMEGLPAVPVEPARRPPPPTPPRDPAQQEDNAMPQATRGTAAAAATSPITFAADDLVTVGFVVDPATAEFKVDTQKRTISGLAVPWNVVARSGGSKWKFAPGSLHWASESRVKLDQDHMPGTEFGRALTLKSSPVGLQSVFKVGRGAGRDQLLEDADDGIYDGLSVQIDFSSEGDGWTADPADDSVRLVHSATLRKVALTAVPAFDDARVTGVAASRNRKDGPVGDEPQGTKTQTPAAGPDTATTAAFTAAVEAFTNQSADFMDAITQLVEVQQNHAGPAIVDPTRRSAAFQVAEEPLYRFDGSRGKEDFSSDIIAGAKGDHEALARVQGWVRATFSGQSSAEFVNQANVASLNPPIQRPDLYVDQLEYPTPLWDSINKGTIMDNTPFVLPKFASSGNLVNNHAEGTEPTNGTFTTTSQTITPSAVSGKVEITREAWDQGGNPQLSTILWRQMVRAYNEALEQSSATLLDGLAVTTITLTAGGTDDVITSEVKAALAALHFIRGGFRMRDFKLERGLYTKLANAKDADGRPLFPVIAPANSDGTMAPFFGALDIAGLAGMPAWALPYVAGAPNHSYLYDREDVHGWASAPQRLEFEYRVAFVDIAVWGYKALACTRTDGVRKITYDEVA